MARHLTDTLLLALALGGVAAPGDANAMRSVRTAPCHDRSHRTGTVLMRKILIADAMPGGGRVTDFRLDDRCRTTIVTARRSTTIDWTKVTDIVARTNAGRRIMTIERAGGPVVMRVADKGETPAGNAALQLESGFGLLADACGA